MQGQVIQSQNTLKQKEKEQQQLKGNINELKQLTEQKKKQIEALQEEVKIAVSQKVRNMIIVYFLWEEKLCS